MLVRYKGDGSPDFIRYPSAPNARSFTVTALPDGGVAETDIEEYDVFGDLACRLRRFDAAGDLLWTSDLAQPFAANLFGAACSNVHGDSTGRIWLLPPFGTLVTVNSDGTAGPVISTSDMNVHQITTAAGAGVFVAGAAGNPDIDPANTLATVWKMTTQGIEWSRPAPAGDAGSMLDDIVTAGDGSIWAFGHKGAQLYGMHLDTDGTLLWSGAFETAVAPVQVRVVARSDGGVTTLHWDTGAFESQAVNSIPELSRISAAGVRPWHVSTGLTLPNLANTSQLRIAAALNGDSVAALSYYGGQADAHFHVKQMRLDADGNPLYLTPPTSLQSLAGFELQALADSSSLTTTGSFRRLDRNSLTLPAPQTTAITTATNLDDRELIAADGATYLLSVNSASKAFSVSAYSSAGALRWQSPIASSWNNGGLLATQVVLRAGDVCVAGYLDGNEMVQCFALTNGSPAPQLTLASSIDPSAARTQAVATDAGEIVLLYVASDGTAHHVLLDAQGAVVHDVTPLIAGETWRFAAQNAAGDTVVSTAPSGLLKLAADGSRSYAVTTDIGFLGVALAADGSAILTAFSTAPVLERLDGNGNRLWQTTMPAGPYIVVRSIRFSANAVYVVVVYNFSFGGAEPQLTGLVAKLAQVDGTVDWSAPLPYIFGHTPRLALDASAETLFAFSSWGDRTRVAKFATADGAALGAKFELCEVDQCELYQAIVANDGTLRMVHDTSDLFIGSAWELTTMQDEFDKIFAGGFDF